MLPLPNAYRPIDSPVPERLFPLVVYVCTECFLVQVVGVETTEGIFGHYAYFSSFAETCLASARSYSSAVVERLSLGPDSLVIEAGSNDGYLLQYFRDGGVPVLGIEPAANVAAVARERGIPTLTRPFGVATAKELVASGKRADLLIVNNVLAHVPDLHDFVGGLSIAVADHGTISIEFPHVMQLLQDTLFDTIYHEHFSYLSLLTVQRVLAAHHLQVVDVEEIATHGGSLRLFVMRAGLAASSKAVAAAEERERTFGLNSMETYRRFADAVAERRSALRDFFHEARSSGKRVAGYGAPAKASTLLNYCDISEELLEYTVDRNHHKQGRFVPGTRIPILPPEHLTQTRPDYILILPWNLREEIVAQMSHVRQWGARFVVPLPRMEVIE